MYFVSADIQIAAPRSMVFDMLADYEGLENLSNRFKESRLLDPAADGTQRIYTRIEGCVWFFCRSVSRYARLTLVPPGEIRAEVEPEGSDFYFGRERWLLEDSGAGTRVIYTHELDPKFWVPPLIGPYVLKRTLSADALAVAERMERIARRER